MVRSFSPLLSRVSSLFLVLTFFFPVYRSQLDKGHDKTYLWATEPGAKFEVELDVTGGKVRSFVSSPTPLLPCFSSSPNPLSLLQTD